MSALVICFSLVHAPISHRQLNIVVFVHSDILAVFIYRSTGGYAGLRSVYFAVHHYVTVLYANSPTTEVVNE